jgi:hypothetical protein
MRPEPVLVVVVVGYAMVLVGDPVASTGLPSIREGLDAETSAAGAAGSSMVWSPRPTKPGCDGGDGGGGRTGRSLNGSHRRYCASTAHSNGPRARSPTSFRYPTIVR